MKKAPGKKNKIMIEAFPLDWPLGYQRTKFRTNSLFKQQMDQSQIFLRHQVKLLGGKGLIVSTNIPLRKDGGMYTEYMNKTLTDPGVAIFFKYKDKSVTMCCDKYVRVWENIYALGKGIEALRGMERWGVSEFLERTFTGFAALPESSTGKKDLWEVLGLNGKPETIDRVHQAFKAMARIKHPDAGGTVYDFQELNESYQKALEQFS